MATVITRFKVDTAQYDAKIKSAKANLNSFGKAGAGAMDGFTKAISANVMKFASWTAVIAGAAKVVGDIVRTNKEFEQSNANLAAVLGTTRDNITALTEDAKKLGASTMYTASQVTSLQTELAKLGFNQSEIKNATKDVLNFAAATGADLGGSAALCGAALRSWGLDAKDMGRVASSMAVATSKSALSYEKLASSLSTVAPVAAKFGFSIEDTLALLGKLSDAGFDASSAATATRNIFLNMADSSGKLAQALGRPIKSLDDLAPALGELQAKGIDLAEMLNLTDKRSVAAFATLVSGSSKLTDLRNSITNCDAALQGMVDEQMNTLQGSTLIMQSAWEGLMLSFSDSVNGPLKSVVDSVTKVITKLTELSKTGKVKKALQDVATVVKSLTVAYIGFHTKAIATTVWTFIVTGATKAKTAVLALNTAIKANPFMFAATAIATAVVAIKGFVSSSKEAENALSSVNRVAETNQDLQKQIKSDYDTQCMLINRLIGVIHDEKLSLDERRNAILRLQDIIPNYHASLSDEGTLIEQNTDAVRNYISALEQQIRLQAYSQRLTDLFQQRANTGFDPARRRTRESIEDDLLSGREGISLSGMSQTAQDTFIQNYIATTLSAQDVAEAEYNSITEVIDDIERQIREAGLITTTSSSTPTGGNNGTTTTTTPAPAEGSIDAQQQKVQELRAAWEAAASDEARAQIKIQLDEANAELDRMMGKTKEVKTEMEIAFTPGSLNALNEELRDAQEALANIEIGAEGWAEALDRVRKAQEAVNAAQDKINPKTQTPVDNAKSTTDAWQNAAMALQSAGAAMNSIEDPAAKVAGTLAQAVASIMLGFAQASIQGAALGPWGWIATTMAGLATAVAAVSTIKSVTSGFEYGGTVLPNGSPYHGDNIVARLNAGEGVLTERGVQTAEQLSGKAQISVSGGNLSTKLKGGDILIALDNTNRSRGGSRGTYAYSK